METTAGPTGHPLRSDRFLLGILIGIAALLVVALLVAIFLRQPAQDLPADTPGGTVQRFLQALERADYDGAYAFLSNSIPEKPTREDFARYNADRASGQRIGQRLRIEREQITGESASVTVEVTYFSTGGPFVGSNQWTTSENFLLRREGNDWRITSLPPNYWPLKYLR